MLQVTRHGRVLDAGVSGMCSPRPSSGRALGPRSTRRAQRAQHARRLVTSAGAAGVAELDIYRHEPPQEQPHAVHVRA